MTLIIAFVMQSLFTKYVQDFWYLKTKPRPKTDTGHGAMELSVSKIL